MKVFIEKDNDIKALEEKVNKKLESLEAEGVTIKGITCPIYGGVGCGH